RAQQDAPNQLEFTVGPKIAELEAKLLFDKHYRAWIFAGNLIGAREWEFEGPGETERETELALTWRWVMR
ncbi:MAG: hypothetical protein ACM3ZE_28640, partial [Myxococcales bacterium]